MTAGEREALTAESLRELLDYDPETGIFMRRRTRGSAVCGKPIVSLNGAGYIQFSVLGKAHRGHRLAWLYVHGEWPSDELDHINGIRNDNRIANLRIISSALNKQNRRWAQSNNKSGVMGAYWCPRQQRWRASIQLHSKTTHLGHFGSKEEAGAAYLAAKRLMHEACTI